MDEARKGQIALLYVKHRLRVNGIRLDSSFKREIGNLAKSTGVPVEEAMNFAEIMIREVVEETFKK